MRRFLWLACLLFLFGCQHSVIVQPEPLLPIVQVAPPVRTEDLSHDIGAVGDDISAVAGALKKATTDTGDTLTAGATAGTVVFKEYMRLRDLMISASARLALNSTLLHEQKSRAKSISDGQAADNAKWAAIVADLNSRLAAANVIIEKLGSEEAKAEAASRLRFFFTLCALIGLGVGGLVFYGFHQSTPASIISAIALGVIGGALASGIALGLFVGVYGALTIFLGKVLPIVAGVILLLVVAVVARWLYLSGRFDPATNTKLTAKAALKQTLVVPMPVDPTPIVRPVQDIPVTDSEEPLGFVRPKVT